MRKIILYMFTSVDGFIAGPNGEPDDYEPSEEEHRFANELFEAADALLFGRVVYELFTAYWDTVDLTDATVPAVEREFAELFQRKPRVVFSRTLEQVDPKARRIKDNLTAEVTALKQQPGRDLLLICGPELLATLVDQGLVDEYLLLIKPTVLGRGKALFGALQNNLRLSLVSTRVFTSGAVLHHYAGAPR